MTFLAGQILTADELNGVIPLGRIVELAGTSTGAMSSIGLVVAHPSASATITNNDTETRQYVARAQMRFRMPAGGPGLYRALVVDGTPAQVGTSVMQVLCTTAGAAGAVGQSIEYPFTLAAGASVTLGSGCLRVAGGGATDYSEGSTFTIDDLGRV